MKVALGNVAQKMALFKRAIVCGALIFALSMFGLLAAPPQAAQATVVSVAYGAIWDYGTVPGFYGWSHLSSGSKWHSSSVYGGGSYVFSGNIEPGGQARAELWACFSSFSAYYNIW